MEEYYYLTPDRQTQGPVSAEQLQAMHRSGQLAADSLVARAGDAGWNRYADLFPAAAASLAAPPPPVPPTIPPLTSRPSPLPAGPAMAAGPVSGGAVPQPARGGSKLWRYLTCGCLGVIGLGVVGIAAIVFLGLSALRQSEPSQAAFQRVQNNPAATEYLGTPVTMGPFVLGSVNVDASGSGHADMKVPVKGSKNSGNVHVVGDRENGRWTYPTMTLETGDPAHNVDLTTTNQ